MFRLLHESCLFKLTSSQILDHVYKNTLTVLSSRQNTLTILDIIHFQSFSLLIVFVLFVSIHILIKCHMNMQFFKKNML